jgi:hypothetical protein
MFNDLRSEVIVHFVDIGGIVDHHCFNFQLDIVRALPEDVFTWDVYMGLHESITTIQVNHWFYLGF